MSEISDMGKALQILDAEHAKAEAAVSEAMAAHIGTLETLRRAIIERDNIAVVMKRISREIGKECGK